MEFDVFLASCRYLDGEGAFISPSGRPVVAALEWHPGFQSGAWGPEPSAKYFGKLDSTGITAPGLGSGCFP